MKYKCVFCDYETDNRGVWYNHKKSQKHLKLEEIENNKKQLVKASSLIDSSIGTLIQKNEIDLLKEKLKSLENEKKIIQGQLDKIVDQYENRLVETKEHYKITIENYEDHIETLKLENNFQKQLINSAGGIIQRSMNTMSYLLLNYNNAPPLTQLSDYSIMSKNIDCLMNDLIYYYKKNKLDKHIGDFIVQQYKKKEPELQSIWSSDVDRLNYFIRELINDSKPQKNQSIKSDRLIKSDSIIDNDNKKFQWVIDKKGIKMTEYIIDPLLNYINKISTAYLHQKNREINENFNVRTDTKLLEDIQIVASINCDIKNNTLSKNINKYIAPHFYLDKKE